MDFLQAQGPRKPGDYHSDFIKTDVHLTEQLQKRRKLPNQPSWKTHSSVNIYINEVLFHCVHYNSTSLN